MSKVLGHRYPQEFKEQMYALDKAGQSALKLSSEFSVLPGIIYK